MDRFNDLDDGVIDEVLSSMFNVAPQCFDGMLDDLVDYTARRDGVVCGMRVA